LLLGWRNGSSPRPASRRIKTMFRDRNRPGKYSIRLNRMALQIAAVIALDAKRRAEAGPHLITSWF